MKAINLTIHKFIKGNGVTFWKYVFSISIRTGFQHVVQAITWFKKFFQKISHAEKVEKWFSLSLNWIEIKT